MQLQIYRKVQIYAVMSDSDSVVHVIMYLLSTYNTSIPRIYRKKSVISVIIS